MYNEPEKTFGEPEFNQEEANEIITNVEINSKNPLKNVCEQVSDHENVIPVIESSLKHTTINKPTLKQHPQIARIKNPKTNLPNKVTPLRIIPRNFVCNICGKRFKSTYHLKRHINGVHKNFSELSNQTKPKTFTQPEELISTQPQVFPQQMSSNFQNWQKDDDIINSSNNSKPPTPVKRKVSKAELKYIRPSKTQKIEREDFDDWNMS